MTARTTRPADTMAERRSASELIKPKRPKGTLPPRAYEAERLVREEEKGFAEIAAIIGVTSLTVERYVSQVRCERRGT